MCPVHLTHHLSERTVDFLDLSGSLMLFTQMGAPPIYPKTQPCTCLLYNNNNVVVVVYFGCQQMYWLHTFLFYQRSLLTAVAVTN